MKLLVVNWLDRENPRAGGAETHLHEIFGRLAERGHEVTALVSGWPGLAPRAELDGMQIHRVGGRHTFFLKARGYARRYFAGRGYDLAVEDLNKVPLHVPRWRVAPPVLLVHHLFGRVAFQEASFPLALATWLLERPIGRRYRGVPTVAVSASTRDDLVRRGLDASDIEVVENGVDLDALTPSPTRDADPTLVYLGRLQRYKRVDLVLRAVDRLRADGLPVRLQVAGRGPAEPDLRRLTAELDLEPHVEFLGFVPEETKPRLLGRSWVHVLASPKEGWGITNLEAAACGTPTVASDSPGLRDSVVEGETGFLAPHGDVDALAERIARLVRDPALRDRMGAAARRFAEARSWAAQARRFERYLEARVAARESPS